MTWSVVGGENEQHQRLRYPAAIHSSRRRRSVVAEQALSDSVELAPDGTLNRVKIADPSFFNWPALPVALADRIVPDSLTNKSFNLLYAGNDL